MAKNVIVSNDLKSYKKKYGKAYSKGKLASFSKKEVNSLYGKGIKNSRYIMDKHKNYELIGDTYYEKPNTKKKAVIIGAALAVAGAAGGTTAYLILTNDSVGQAVVSTLEDGNLIVSGSVAKKGSSYTGTIQVPTEKQSTKTLPYVIKEVKTGNKVLSLKAENANAEEENYYCFDRHNDSTGEIYIHKVEGAISVLVELNDKEKSTRVEKVEIVSSFPYVELNSTVHLSAKVYPEYASNKGVTWEVYEKDGVTNSSLASINRYGDLTVKDTTGTVKIVAVSNDTLVRSEPLELSLGSPKEEEEQSFAIYENYGSQNVRVSQNESTGNVKNLNLDVEGLHITALEPVYNYGHGKNSSKGAFEGLTNLTTVTLPSTIIEISENCFKNCTNLTTVVIPANVRGIAKGAFKGCTSLKKVIFTSDSQLQAIEEGAFEGCAALETFGYESTNGDVIVPDTIDTIAANAFKGCNPEKFVFAFSSQSKTVFNATNGTAMLHNVEATIIDSTYLTASETCVISLVKYDESNEQYIKYFTGAPEEEVCTVYFNEYIEEAYKQVSKLDIRSHMICQFGDNKYILCKVVACGGFYALPNLTTVNLPYTLKDIEANCFEDCYNLVDVHIPSSVKNIYESAFYNVDDISGFKIDEGVENIYDSAFAIDDTVISSKITTEEKIFTLPSSVRTIGSYCFLGRGNLDGIVFTGNTYKDDNGNEVKYDWYSTYASYTNDDSLAAASLIANVGDGSDDNDIDLDENKKFAYQHFENESETEYPNVTKLTSPNKSNKGYARYSFYKNVVREFKYSDKSGAYIAYDEPSYFSSGFYSYETIKNNVDYCYVIDYSKKENENINTLYLNYSTNSLQALSKDGESYSNPYVHIASIIATDGNEKTLFNYDSATDDAAALAKINEINNTGEINLDPYTNNDKIYLKIKFDVSSSSTGISGRNTYHMSSRSKDKKESVIDISVHREEIDDGTRYNYTNFFNIFAYHDNQDPLVYDEDTKEYYGTIHLIEDGDGDYMTSNNSAIPEGIINYELDCSELAKYSGQEVPTYSHFCLYNSSSSSSTELIKKPEISSDETAAYYYADESVKTPIALGCRVDGSVINIDYSKLESKMPPTTGKIIIRVKFKAASTNSKWYFFCRPEGEAPESDILDEIDLEATDFDGDSKND